MRTPSSALPAAPQGLMLGRGRPFAAAGLADLAGFFDFNFTTFFAAVFDFALALLFAVLRFLVAIVDLLISLMPGTNRARMFPYFLRTALCGLSLPMRPLSVPAAGSITALMRVGLPESMAASTARLSSSGVVA